MADEAMPEGSAPMNGVPLMVEIHPPDRAPHEALDDDVERAAIGAEPSVGELFARVGTVAPAERDQAVTDADVAYLATLPVQDLRAARNRGVKAGLHGPTLDARIKLVRATLAKQAEAREAEEGRKLLSTPRERRAPPVKLTSGTVEKTEHGAAELLMTWYRAELRFTHGLGWIAWDGRRWAQDDARAAELVKLTLRRMRIRAADEYEDASRHAAALIASHDSGAMLAANEALNTVKALLKYLDHAQSARGVAGILASASSIPCMRADVNALDADPYLFNVANGTLDFRTGELRPHDSRDMITRLGPCAYSPEPDEYDAQWHDYLIAACLGDDDLFAWMRLVAGYSLTGEAGQEELYFLSGLPGSGKGTFIDGVKCVMGDYAGTTSFDTWIRRDGSVAAQRPDLAKLIGLRMVSCSEVDADKKLDEGVISNATGGDEITACHKYKDPFTFLPRFKLWLLANKKPRVNNIQGETGIWRRLKVIPFDLVVRAGDKDPDLKRRFRDPLRGGPAVLRFLLAGAVEYVQLQRIRECPRVTRTTDDYREENNPIKDFFAEHYVSDDSYVTASSLRAAYEAWAKVEGIKFPITGKEMAKQLKQPPYSCTPDSVYVARVKTRIWRGLREQRPQDDEIQQPAPSEQ